METVTNFNAKSMVKINVSTFC